MVDDIARASLLYDFYGQLLTEKQRNVMELYHEENLSLSEIADELGISRQGVYDSLKKAEQSLSDYENKLSLVGQFIKTADVIKEIDARIDYIIENIGRMESGEAAEKLGDIKAIINGLEK